MNIDIMGDGKYFITTVTYREIPKGCVGNEHATIVFTPTPYLLELLQLVEELKDHKDNYNRETNY